MQTLAITLIQMVSARLVFNNFKKLKPCSTDCETCFGPLSTQCLSCIEGSAKPLFDIIHHKCVDICPSGSTSNGYVCSESCSYFSDEKDVCLNCYNQY